MTTQSMSEYELEQHVIAFRRTLHRIPELDFDLPKTRAFLTSVLEPLGCELRDLGKAGFAAYFPAVAGSPGSGGAAGGAALDRPSGGVAFCGEMTGGMVGGMAGGGAYETIAFRSDMDAIPIEEPASVGCAFRSEHTGAMHACGHDGHMAMLLGIALWIAGHRNELRKNCLLIFQAAEETTGGAELICETGALRDFGVSRVYGLHLWPGYTAHTVICRPNEFMAGMFVLNIDIVGQSAHIAEYRNGADALEAGCLLVLRAYELERALPDNVFRLLRFGEFSSGTANNIVSAHTRITGAVRAYDDKTFDYFKSGLENIMRGVETETGVKIYYARSKGYPALINPPELYAETRRILTEAGFAWLEPEAPILQAEDFSYYQREAPGLFMHLGTGGGARLHSPEYTLDEGVLMTGVRLMRTLLTADAAGVV